MDKWVPNKIHEEIYTKKKAISEKLIAFLILLNKSEAILKNYCALSSDTSSKLVTLKTY